jgi:predicted lipoprotein
MKRHVSPLVTTVCLAAACQASVDGPTGPSRAELLSSLATTVFLPTFIEFEQDALGHADAVATLCAGLDDASLVSAQSAWMTARVPLTRADAWRFGPIVDLRIDTAVDFWPARPDAVETAVADPAEATDDWVTSLGTAAKGLPAVEYLLFDPIGGNEAILGSFDATATTGARRCDVTAALASRVATRATELRAAWDPTEGNYAGLLAADGDDSPGHPSLQMATDDVVNALITALRDITDARLGRPLGDKTAGTPQPDDVASRFSDHGYVEMVATLEGVERVYLGDGGLGLTDVVISLDADLDAAIRIAIEDAKAAIAGLSMPLRLAVVADPAPVIQARNVVNILRRLVEVDLATLLGINVGLNDNDGD